MDLDTVVCDICGRSPAPGRELDGQTLVPASDLLLCAECLAGRGEDNRDLCPRCGLRVPVSFSLAHWNDENIFEDHCPCGHVWDEREEGDTKEIWELLLRAYRSGILTEDTASTT